LNRKIETIEKIEVIKWVDDTLTQSSISETWNILIENMKTAPEMNPEINAVQV
jgi:hypothetical protein